MRLDNRPVLAIDMDDVTAMLNDHALNYRNLDFPDNVLTINDLHDWDANWDIMKDYYMKDGIYAELAVASGAVEVLRELNERYHVIFLTASPTIGATVEKMEWVDRHFDFIGSQNVIATRYKYLINADLLFDDSPSFIRGFTGIRVLHTQPYNVNLEAEHFDYRVGNWYEFRDLIEALENANALAV